jgi:hypothetical protein
MALFISKSNAIKFRLHGQAHPNFDNVMVQDEHFGANIIHNEIQKYYYQDELVLVRNK